MRDGIAPVAADSLARAGWHWSGNPGELSDWRETRLQRLEVSHGPPTVVFADGQLVGHAVAVEIIRAGAFHAEAFDALHPVMVIHRVVAEAGWSCG